MSEPDISTLARRLAEQNNVDWRVLTGTGEGGKVVERDVLDYLARVMAGEEALDPTPEPLPEGMEAWPDKDAPTYFDRNAPRPAPPAPPTEQLQDATADIDGDGADATAAGLTPGAFAPDADSPFVDEESADDEDDDLLSDDIFLFDDEPATDVASAYGAGGSGSGDMGSSDFESSDFGSTDFGSGGYGAGQRFAEPTPPADEDDGVLLVADDLDDGDLGSHLGSDVGSAFGSDFGSDLGSDLGRDLGGEAGGELGAGFGGDLSVDSGDAADAGKGEDLGADLRVDFGGVPDAGAHAVPGAGTDAGMDAGRAYGSGAPELGGGPSAAAGDETSEQAAAPDLGANVFERPLASYSEEFTTPSEQFENGGAGGWSGGDLSAEGAFDLSGGEPAADLPDLWATEAAGASAKAEDVDAVEDVEVDAEMGGHVEVDADVDLGTGLEPVLEAEADADTAASADADTDSFMHGDDVTDLEQAELLDELDAVADLEALDGDTELDGSPAPADAGGAPGVHTLAAEPGSGAAATAGLPFMRTGNVIRRHLDLTALASAQLAAGLELGLDEPLTPAPFLLRAVAKAASGSAALAGQVALAELEGELRFRRVDDAAGRTFAALVTELTGDGPEEDELGLAVVDLSGFDIDEVLLDLDVPAVTLGRILYDTQQGAYRSTLTLTGKIPLEQGSALLNRVAELLTAPIRLLL